MITFEDWAKQYPGHCTECFGLGIKHWVGDINSEPVSDFCICIYDYECPRCGEPIEVLPEDDYGIWKVKQCTHCNWDSNNGINDSFWPDVEELGIDF